jgi:ABC-type ATPase with predicted acetyltransferase domain
MSDRADVTGRDSYLLVEALTFMSEALSGLPIELRPDNNIADMKRLVEKFVKQDAGLAQSQLIARRRLDHVLAYGTTNRA